MQDSEPNTLPIELLLERARETPSSKRERERERERVRERE